MPRAGWCRECGAWIWVDADAGCPAGHPAESVVDSYDAQPVAPAAVRDGVGEGDAPASMLRFNWGAFFVPGLWALVYGVWPLIGLWLAAVTFPLALGFAVGLVVSVRGDALSLAALIGVTVVSELVVALSRLWTGANANRLYWKREASRLAAGPAAMAVTSVPRFLGRQGKWRVWGATGAVVATAITVPAAAVTWRAYGLGWAAVAEPIVWLGAEIALGIWLSGRMRLEHLELSPDTQESDT